MRLALVLCVAAAASAQTWEMQTSGTRASLRGVSALSAQVVWASGTGGTYLHTVDGGAHWTAAQVAGAEGLDFRDAQATDARTVYLMSAGTGDKARIYKTVEGGSNWKLVYTNPDAKGFFDAIAFWDARRGVVAGDPVDGQIAVFTTMDGGTTWQRRAMPPALAGEGSFAASGTCLIVTGRNDIWIGTGGPGAARVFHSPDAGRTWTVVKTPIRNDGASAGIFSLAFSDSRHGIAVGGDYNKPTDTTNNIAITTDGGRTWVEPNGTPPHGFRSAVAYIASRKMWVVTGTSGSDVSGDGGRTWKQVDAGAFNALAFLPSGAGWAVGPQGRVATFHLK